LFALMEGLLIAASVSLDAFTAGFSYGSQKIRIPLGSSVIITLISSIVIGIALLAGAMLAPLLPDWIVDTVSFILLFSIGAVKLMDSVTKSIITKYNDLHREIKISLFNFKFILSLYADPEKADVDGSCVLSASESFFLGVTLSLDGLAAGFGAALLDLYAAAVVVSSLVTGFLAITGGHFIGERIAGRLPFNISWLSGAVFILLAFSKIF